VHRGLAGRRGVGGRKACPPPAAVATPGACMVGRGRSTLRPRGLGGPALVVPYLAGNAKVEKPAALRSGRPFGPRSPPGDRPTLPPGLRGQSPRRPPAARGGVV